MPGLSLTLPISFSDTTLPKLPVVLVSDSFNRPDTASAVLGTADAALGGVSAAWEVDANVSIGGNRWKVSGQSTNRSSRVDTGSTDHKVEAVWYEGAGGLLARYVDASNHYRLLVVVGRGLEFYRMAGGTNTPLLGPGPMPVPGDRVSLAVRGAVVRVEHNGVLVWEYTDKTPVLGGTRAGLRSAFTEATVFDDFVVTNV